MHSLPRHEVEVVVSFTLRPIYSRENRPRYPPSLDICAFYFVCLTRNKALCAVFFLKFVISSWKDALELCDPEEV